MIIKMQILACCTTEYSMIKISSQDLIPKAQETSSTEFSCNGTAQQPCEHLPLKHLLFR